MKLNTILKHDFISHNDDNKIFRMYSTSKMTGKVNFNEKLHKYLQTIASKSGRENETFLKLFR